MGAWGVEALESDEGLDVLHLIFHAQRDKWTLSDMFELLRENDYMPENPADVDFFYDTAYITVAEMLVEYIKDGSISYETSVNNKETTLIISDITYNDNDLMYLIDALTKLVRPLDEPHEFYLTWEDSDSFEEWKTHVSSLIDSLIDLKS